MRAATSIVVAALVGIAACSSDDTDATTPSTETTTTSTTVATTEVEPVDDRTEEDLARDLAAAEQVVLRADDLGPGWQPDPVPELDVDALDDGLADCLGTEPDQLYRDDPSAVSDLFVVPDPLDDRSIEAEVMVVASEEIARQLLERYRDGELVECVGQDYHDVVVETFAAGGDGLRDDLVVGELGIERLTLPAVGDDHVAIRYQIPVSASDLDVAIYLDRTAVQVGRLVIFLSAGNTVEPFPDGLFAQALEAMASRVPADL